jgi:hypothetical protein
MLCDNVLEKNLVLKNFIGSTDQKYFNAFLKIKYQVFIDEMGWTSLPHSKSDKSAFIDSFDKASFFTVITNQNGQTLGIGRATLAKNGLPHKTLYQRHLNQKTIKSLNNNIATINSIAVIRGLRGKLYMSKLFKNEITIGQYILFALTNWIRKFEGQLIFISTQISCSLNFFTRSGYYLIDSPFYYSKSPKPLVNMAMLVNDQDHLIKTNSCLASNFPNIELSSTELNTKTYLKSCQYLALQRDLISFQNPS